MIGLGNLTHFFRESESRLASFTDIVRRATMRRTYKFLLRPTRRQELALTACLEDTRMLYDAALEERPEALVV
jgi:hypothetical protein